MIADSDRSGYFGASDTKYIVGKWTSRTFEKWWRVKQGIDEMNYKNDAMCAGTYYEHRILDSLEIPGMEKDKQVIQDRLRVNLDGNTKDCIYEVKTYRFEKGFRFPKEYREQVWVQMYITGFRKSFIVAYGLQEEDYKNYYNDIDKKRLSLIPVEYNEEFITTCYIPRLAYLTECLKKGVFPYDGACINPGI